MTFSASKDTTGMGIPVSVIFSIVIFSKVIFIFLRPGFKIW